MLRIIFNTLYQPHIQAVKGILLTINGTVPSKLKLRIDQLSRKLISEVTVGQNAVQEYQQNFHVIQRKVGL